MVTREARCSWCGARCPLAWCFGAWSTPSRSWRRLGAVSSSRHDHLAESTGLAVSGLGSAYRSLASRSARSPPRGASCAGGFRAVLGRNANTRGLPPDDNRSPCLRRFCVICGRRFDPLGALLVAFSLRGHGASRFDILTMMGVAPFAPCTHWCTAFATATTWHVRSAQITATNVDYKLLVAIWCLSTFSMARVAASAVREFISSFCRVWFAQFSQMSDSQARLRSCILRFIRSARDGYETGVVRTRSCEKGRAIHS